MRFSTSLVASLSVVGLVAALPEPQAPGSEKYECHSKCGGIISASRKDDFVSTCASHRAAYSYCLSCAGPEAQNIWSMYGNSVSAAGEKCGWPTTPGADFPAEAPAEEEEEEEKPETTTTKTVESTTTPAPVVTPTTTTEVEATTTSVPVEPTTTAPVEEEEEEETPVTSEAPEATTTAPLTTSVPVVNNGTVGGNSTNGGAIPTPESDGAASVRFVSAGVIAVSFAAVAFLL